MGKSEQTGGGGGTEMTPRKEPKPKRPWSKPRLMLIEMDFTLTGGSMSPETILEADINLADGVPGVRYRSFS